MWRIDDPQGDEAAKCIWDVIEYVRGTGLDVGCGPRKALPSMIGVDSTKDTALFGIDMTPDNVVDDASYLPMVPDGRLDYVFSSHLLEHIVDYEAALAEWWRILKVGGHLVLYLPHRDHYPNIGQPGANIDHKHDFVAEDIIAAMNTIARRAEDGFDVLVNEVRAERNEYSFLLVIKKELPRAADDTRLHTYCNPRPVKTACISRYGGFGDMIQMSALLPTLKQQGYHVTVNTTPAGMEIVKHDPHIDRFMLQDVDQVPNPSLPDFWASQARRFDKFIQLSESIEGTLLAMPGRANHAWPHGVRKVELNRNYLEWCAQLAELPYSSDARFYPSPDEVTAATQFRQTVSRAMNPDLMIGQAGQPVFTIMWALSGSSVHKFYPHMDAVVARILTDLPRAVIVFTGDEPCQLLEQGWELEPRVYRLSGKQTIRETLSLATQVDCVLGPETGVLNAVAFDAGVAKVVMLSHSTERNLTMHWLNTVTLAPMNTPCYPCHQLHFGWAHCHQEPVTGAALCAYDISPAAVFAGVQAMYQEWAKWEVAA